MLSDIYNIVTQRSNALQSTFKNDKEWQDLKTAFQVPFEKFYLNGAIIAGQAIQEIKVQVFFSGTGRSAVAPIYI